MGDRIQIGPHVGDVVDIRVFQTTLLEIGNWVDADQTTGRLPDRIAANRGGDAGRAAAAALGASVARLALRPGQTEPQVYLRGGEDGIQLTIRVPCEPRRRREVTTAIWDDVLALLAAEPDIDLAYRTTRFYSRVEGEPTLRPPVAVI